MAMLEKHKHEHASRDFDGLIEMRVNPPPRYFSILFYGLVVWGVLFSAYYLLSGWSSEKEFRQEMAAFRERTQVPAPAPAAMVPGAVAESEQGQELYGRHCAACHGAEGKGGIGPDLTDAEYRYGRSPEAVSESISNGRPDGMPAFGNQLSAGEVESLTAFVLQLK